MLVDTTLRIEIENRTTKDQIEKNIRKNLEYSDTLYEIATDEIAKKKLIQVALMKAARTPCALWRRDELPHREHQF